MNQPILPAKVVIDRDVQFVGSRVPLYVAKSLRDFQINRQNCADFVLSGIRWKWFPRVTTCQAGACDCCEGNWFTIVPHTPRGPGGSDPDCASSHVIWSMRSTVNRLPAEVPSARSTGAQGTRYCWVPDATQAASTEIDSPRWNDVLPSLGRSKICTSCPRQLMAPKVTINPKMHILTRYDIGNAEHTLGCISSYAIQSCFRNDPGYRPGQTTVTLEKVS